MKETMFKLAMKYSKGNPGALQAFMGMINGDNIIHSLSITIRLETCKSIRGTNLYVLWSDLCNKDYAIMSKLCKSEISNEVLEDACNRQDYSGRELVKDFIKDGDDKDTIQCMGGFYIKQIKILILVILCKGAVKHLKSLSSKDEDYNQVITTPKIKHKIKCSSEAPINMYKVNTKALVTIWRMLERPEATLKGDLWGCYLYY